MPASSDDSKFQARIEAFLQEMQQSGWLIGRNIRIDTRWTRGNADDARKYAAELVALAPDVILAAGASTVRPLLQATRTAPIVFPVVGDPVAAGFVDSQARPGGNATGFMAFEYTLSAKWVELLKEIAPHVTRAAVLRDAAVSSGLGQFGVVAAAIGARAIELKRQLSKLTGDGTARIRVKARRQFQRPLRPAWLAAWPYLSDEPVGRNVTSRT